LFLRVVELILVNIFMIKSYCGYPLNNPMLAQVCNLCLKKPSSRNSPPTKWHKDLTTTRYEITNHLGNVLSTITGRKLGIEDGAGLLVYYLPEVVTASDYYAFGEQVCSSHTKWLVDAVKRSFRPAAKRGAISEVKTLCALAKVLLRITHARPFLRKSRFFWNK